MRSKVYAPVIRQEPTGRRAPVTWAKFIEAGLLRSDRRNDTPGRLTTPIHLSRSTPTWPTGDGRLQRRIHKHEESGEPRGHRGGPRLAVEQVLLTLAYETWIRAADA